MAPITLFRRSDMLQILISLSALIGAASLVTIANATMTTIMPLRLLQDGADETTVALFGAAYSLGFAVGCFSEPCCPACGTESTSLILIAMAAPKAVMVVSGTKDPLFPPLGQREAARQIADAYAWADCAARFRDYAPDKEHCYDAEIQSEALAWFDTHLKHSSRFSDSPRR